MKRRIIIFALLIAVLAAFFPVPRANADPLTVMAVVGLAAVLSAGTVDIAASHHDDDRDRRAQHENGEKILTNADKSAEPSGPREVYAAVQR